MAAFLFSGVCAAQSGPPVVMPAVKVGDSWTYRRFDYDANQQRGRYEMRVVFAERGVIQVVTSQRGTEDESDQAYTEEWNAVTVRGRVINPHSGWFQFPLQVGATYSANYDVAFTGKRQEGAESRNQRLVKVVGWEEIEVPAGKFRALKIVSEGRFQRIDNTHMSGSSRNVIWYVPEVRRWVKITLENRPQQHGRGEHTGEELVEYRLQ